MAKLDGLAESKGINLTVKLAGEIFSNPIMTAAGTFSARESASFYDLNELGAAVTKGVSSEPWKGNETPRIAETFGGVLNSVGLQNPGTEAYKRNELAYLSQFDTKIIANIAGHTIDEYCDAVRKLNDSEQISMFEINISCPNVSEGGMAFGTDPKMAAAVTKAVRNVSKKPIIIKLSPNVTDITEIAKAVQSEGANAISMINTLMGMHIDVKSRRATLARKIGGFSGPAIKPIALRMVWETANAVDLPIIGMGGITKGTDVAEFIAAGASAVAVGTAALSDPLAVPRIKTELIEYMEENRFSTISELRHAFNI